MRREFTGLEHHRIARADCIDQRSQTEKVGIVPGADHERYAVRMRLDKTRSGKIQQIGGDSSFPAPPPDIFDLCIQLCIYLPQFGGKSFILDRKSTRLNSS